MASSSPLWPGLIGTFAASDRRALADSRLPPMVHPDQGADDAFLKPMRTMAWLTNFEDDGPMSPVEAADQVTEALRLWPRA